MGLCGPDATGRVGRAQPSGLCRERLRLAAAPAKNNKGEWWRNKTRDVYHTDFADEYENGGDTNDPDDDDGPVPEEVAEELYEAYMTHETAKAKYRQLAKSRGTDPNYLKKVSEDKLKMAKSRSFCAGCKRKGRWHRDPECPLNQGKPQTSSTAASSGSSIQGGAVKSSFQCHVVHVTWDRNEGATNELTSITDPACSRTVAGAPWLERYLQVLEQKGGGKPVFINGVEKFNFGASKVFESKYSVIVAFVLGKFTVHVSCHCRWRCAFAAQQACFGGYGDDLRCGSEQGGLRRSGPEGLSSPGDGNRSPSFAIGARFSPSIPMSGVPQTPRSRLFR